jgi:hypothetical protein
MIPLQLNFPDAPQWVHLFSQATQFLVAGLGLLIAYTAYKGYRRNDSRAMFFIALGFTLSIAVPFFLVIPLLLFDSSSTTAAVTITSQVATLVGLASILYALRL